MADRLPRNLSDAVARVAAIVDNVRAGVVGVGGQEVNRRMAGTAFRFGDDMAFGLAGRHVAVVAPVAGSGNVGVIEAAVRQELQKVAGIVTRVALGLRWGMELRHSDGLGAVVASAAVAEDILMIHEGNEVEALRRMTGLAGIVGCQMVQRLPLDLADARDVVDLAAMAVHAGR